MDFRETEEQGMIRAMVRDFAEEVLAPTCLERDRAQAAPLDEWSVFCGYGLQGITIPEDYGGSPVDDVSEAIIVEELARVDPSFSWTTPPWSRWWGISGSTRSSARAC